MLKHTNSTITLPIYEMKTRTITSENGKMKRISYHNPTTEEVTILINQIYEINKVKREEESRKGHDGIVTISQKEVIVKIRTTNHSYMVFAKEFAENQDLIEKEADKTIELITKAIDQSQKFSNPFSEVLRLLEDNINKISDIS